MTGLSREERLANLDTMIAEGRILRRQWTAEQDGRKLACILAALSPEAGEYRNASACPANVIPSWFAFLTPDINDRVSQVAWPGIIRRYAAVVRRADVLTDEDWRRLDYAARAVALRVALPHAGASTTVLKRAIALCDRAASGGVVSGPEWDRAAEAAWDVAEDLRREGRTAWEAGQAALAAEQAVLPMAAERAAMTADRAAAAAGAGAQAALAGAWDTIANGVLDAIDAACAAREASS